MAVVAAVAVAVLAAVGWFLGKPAFERGQLRARVTDALERTWYMADSWAEFTRETCIENDPDGTFRFTSGAYVVSGRWNVEVDDEGAWYVYTSENMGYDGSDCAVPFPGGHGRFKFVNATDDSLTLESEGNAVEWFSSEEAALENVQGMLTGSGAESMGSPSPAEGADATLGDAQQPAAQDAAEEDLDVVENLARTWYVYRDGTLSTLVIGSDGFAQIEDYGNLWAREFETGPGRIYGQCSWSYDPVSMDLRLFSFWVRFNDASGSDYSLGGSLNEAMSVDFHVDSLKQRRVDREEALVLTLTPQDGGQFEMYSTADAAMAAAEGGLS